ncbi:MAG: hypothetical protein PWR15_86, partial [Bacteroidota bacterium]|nr:hypothetical protein [Bacteroidota bacterium]
SLSDLKSDGRYGFIDMGMEKEERNCSNKPAIRNS